MKAQKDLTKQFNDADCEDGCRKSGGTIALGNPAIEYTRLWYTAWTIVECEATVTATTTITCSPES